MIDSIVKYVLGKVRLIGDTDGTRVGNYSDRLKTIPIADKNGTGSIVALNGTVAAPTDGCGGITIAISGTWSATLSFEATLNGSTWFAVKAYNLIAETTGLTTITNGTFFIGCGSFAQVRVKATAFTSGTAALVWNTGQAKQTSTQTEVLSPLPGFVARHNAVSAAGRTIFTSYTMTEKIALTQFTFGGRGIGQSSISRVNASATSLVPGGGFDSSGDVALWSNVGLGTSLAATWAYATDQAYAGSGSAKLTFTDSNPSNFIAFKYTWSSAQDLSQWRYASARVRITVAAGGAATRALSLILTDANGATRSQVITAQTNAAPFSTEQWHYLNMEISNPTSETGTFDAYNVVSATVKLQDSGNKAGSIWIDDVKFTESESLIERIYIDANRTFSLALNPTEIFNIGDVLGLACTNNDSASKEFTCTAKGVKA